MFNLLLLILALAFFAAYFYDRLSGNSLTKKLNQNYLERGAHERGQNLVSQEMVFTTHASVAQVRQSILSTVKAEPDIPLLIADAYLIHSTDTQILYGVGNKFHQSFRGLISLQVIEGGTKGSWEIVDWTLRDGIVDGQSVMNRFVADINTALRNVDRNAVLRPKDSATSSSAGTTRSYSSQPPAPPKNNSTETSTHARPQSRDSVNQGTAAHPKTSAVPGTLGASDSSRPQYPTDAAPAGTQARPNAEHIWLQTTTSGLDVCIPDRAAIDSLAIFNQTRYLLLDQLKQHGMGVGRIKTNSRSDRSSNFEASIFPSGKVSLTRGDEAASSTGPANSMQPYVRLTFSDCHTSPDTVTSMVHEISSGLQKQFEEIRFPESTA